MFSSNRRQKKGSSIDFEQFFVNLTQIKWPFGGQAKHKLFVKNEHKFWRAASQMICRAPGWRFLDSSCTQRASWRVKRQSHSWRRRRSHGTVWARLTLECRCQRQYRCFPASWWSQTLWIACSFWELAVLGRCKAVVAPPHRSWSTCAILSRKAASERGSESYYACRRDLSGDSYNQ